MSQSRLRLKTKIQPDIPPHGAIDLFYDAEAGVVKVIDHEGASVSFSGSTGSNSPITTSDLITETGNGSAAAGKLGQHVANTVSFADAFNLVSDEVSGVTIALTPGDWDVEGHITFDESGATVTSRAVCITPALGILGTGEEVYNDTHTTAATQRVTLTASRRRISISVNTNVYLAARAVFSAGSVDMFGHLTARRVR